MFSSFSARKLIYVYSSVMLILVIFCSSCGNTRQFVYMQGQFDTAKLSQLKAIDPIIQKGDLLSIIVYSDDPEATRIFNQPLIVSQSSSGSGAGSVSGTTNTSNEGSTQGSSLASSPTTSGYLVDENGDIEFQKLNRIHVEGLTRSQLKDTLVAKLSQYLTNAYCTIRFLNYRFTMLGEINKPSLYSIPSDHINMFEAIAMAGDITFYGRRDNVLVIREKEGKREFGRVDLTKPEVMTSPYFYLQQNDIVYIEQNKKKAVASDQVTVRNISIATAIVSTIAVVYSILKQ
jgi:polysaccharide export outer membrane protein